MVVRACFSKDSLNREFNDSYLASFMASEIIKIPAFQSGQYYVGVYHFDEACDYDLTMLCRDSERERKPVPNTPEFGKYKLHDWNVLKERTANYLEDYAPKLRPFYQFIEALEKAFGQEADPAENLEIIQGADPTAGVC